MKYRSRNEIISQILESAKQIDGVTKTRILFQAYLSHAQLRDYLSILTESGLLGHDAQTNRYRTTDRGIQVLEAYQKMSELAGIEND